MDGPSDPKSTTFTVTRQAPPQNWRVFILVLLGQVVSAFGSGLTAFALGVWVYQTTGSATRFGLTLFSATIPTVLFSPLAGALVDRWNRRRVMILSDAGAAAATLAIVVLIWSGLLEVWHVYAAVAVNAFFQSFQWPAFTASTTLLVAKKNFSRAGGMSQAGNAVAQALAPMAAGALLVRVGLHGVIFIDMATFLFAVIVLLLVRIPQPEATAEGAFARGALRSETAYGWTYLKERRGLLGLLVMFAAFNFAMALIQVLLTPLILSFADAPTLGSVLSTAALGLVLGGVVMSAWAGPRRRMRGIFTSLAFMGVVLLAGGLGESAVLIAAAAFVYLFLAQIVNASSQAIWQSKVAPDVQGRVFAIRRMIASSVMPLAYLVGGPLAEFVFEPLLADGGPLADTVGRIIGVGPGRGTGLLIITLGLFKLLVVLSGYRYPPLRNIETELPDAVGGDPPPGVASAEQAADQGGLGERGGAAPA